MLALPTVQVLPFPVEQEWMTEIDGEPMATYIDWMRSCSRITVTLHPAITVPAWPRLGGRLSPALPRACSASPCGRASRPATVGRYGDDRRLLEIAAAITALATPA